MSRPEHWTHDRTSFFKYGSVSAVRSILSTSTLKWSSPIQFNDPFDNQFDLHMNIDLRAAKQKILDEDWRILHCEGEFHPVGSLGLLNQLLRQHSQRIGSLTRERFDEEMGVAIDEGLRAGLCHLPELQTQLRRLLSGIKILCLSEAYDDIVMWSHYSDCHRGGVLELRCVPELDSCWGAARPVVYSDTMPSLYTENDLASLMSGQAHHGASEAINRSVYTKAKNWSYEVSDSPTPFWDGLDLGGAIDLR